MHLQGICPHCGRCPHCGQYASPTYWPTWTYTWPPGMTISSGSGSSGYYFTPVATSDRPAEPPQST